MASLIQMLLISILARIILASGPTSIFINQVPEYSLLATCAELEISTIVRDMEYGCGDGSKMTSFACFCYESSAKFSSMIGKHVSTKCTDNPSQNTTAIEVFSKYCALGEVEAHPTDATTTAQLGTATSDSASAFTSALPAPGQSAASATSTSTATAPDKDSEKSGNEAPVVAIAVGVCVPIAVISLGVAGFLLFRRRRSRSDTGPIELSGDGRVNEAYPAKSTLEVHELKQESKVPPLEMDETMVRAELATPTTKYKHEADPVHELCGEDAVHDRSFEKK